jgi:hypothetical protein
MKNGKAEKAIRDKRINPYDKKSEDNENNGKRKKGCSHLFGSHHQSPNCPGSGILRASRRLIKGV